MSPYDSSSRWTPNVATWPRRRALANVVVLLLALPVLVACGTGEGDGGADASTPLASTEIVRGEDDTLLGATEGALDTPTDVTIGVVDENPATLAPLDVEPLGPAYRFTSSRRVDTDTSAPFVVGLSVDVVCPECGDGPIEDLAIAMLLPGDEGHGDPAPGLESRHEGEHPPDRWAFRQAFHDDERGLLLTTVHSLTEEGRIFVVVRDDDFETAESRLPEGGADTLGTVQSDPTFEMRCHPSDFDDVNFSCGSLDRNAAAELFEKAYDDFTSVGFTDSPNLYRVPESVAIDNDEPWAQEGAYVMTLRACSQAIADVGDPGHYWGSNGPGSAYVCYGSNVNWKKTPDPPRAQWVEDIVRHETFHGVQSHYLGGLNQPWMTEGTANAAQESLVTMEVSRAGDDAKGPGARHAVDVPLTATTNNEHYKAEDFWVWLGKRLNQSRVVGEEEGLEYLIPFFERGTGVSNVDEELRTTSAYGGPGFAGLSAAYLDWVRNQAFEKTIQLGPDTLGDVCAYNGTLVDNLLTLSYEPDEAPPSDQTFTLDPLESRVVRFDFGSFPLDSYEAVASVTSADAAVKIKFYDAADASTVDCHGGVGTSEVGSQLVQHQPRDGTHRHYALVSNTDLSQGHDATASVGGNELGVSIIAPADGASYDEGDQVFLEAVATGFRDYGDDFEIAWSYVNDDDEREIIATTGNRESLQTTIPCFTGALTAEASNDDESASTFVNVTCTPAQETFTFLIDSSNSGEVWSDGTVNDDPLSDTSRGIFIGDTEGGIGIRGYLDFDLSTLPNDLASIRSAELTVFFEDASGDPFDDFGALQAVHDEYGDLDASDYPSSTPRPGLYELADAPDPFGNVTVDVTDAVRDAWDRQDIEGEDVQFILFFDIAGSSDDNEDDFWEISARDPVDASPVAPTLDVTIEN